MAGNDAGHAYNTFPLMNGHWIPEDYVTYPGWRNAFESTAAVQLHHRCDWLYHHLSEAYRLRSRSIFKVV